jgi:hypothetical protein
VFVNFKYRWLLIFQIFSGKLPFYKKGEEKKVLYFFLFFAVLMIGQEMGSGVSASIFLTNIGIDKLPWMLLIASIINAIAILGYVALSAKFNNHRQFLYKYYGQVFFLYYPQTPLLNTFPVFSSIFFYAASEFLRSCLIVLHFSVYVLLIFSYQTGKKTDSRYLCRFKNRRYSRRYISSPAARYIGTLNIIFLWASSVAFALLMLEVIRKIFLPSVLIMRKSPKKLRNFLNISDQVFAS